MFAPAQFIPRRGHSNESARGRRRRIPLRPSVETLEVRVLFAGATISGTIFEDITGDGVSAGDAVVPGRVVQLFRDNGDGVQGAGDALAGTDTTRANGSYLFRNLPAGAYFVQQRLPTGWVQTESHDHEHDDPITTPAQAGATPKEKNDTLATAI